MVMRLGCTSDGEAQVAQRGGGERDDRVQAVDLLAQVHRQRLRGPAWQLLQPLAYRLLVKQRRHLHTPCNSSCSVCTAACTPLALWSPVLPRPPHCGPRSKTSTHERNAHSAVHARGIASPFLAATVGAWTTWR